MKEHKISKEDCEKITAIGRFAEAIDLLEITERHPTETEMTCEYAEEQYRKSLIKLLTLLLGREPTEYEINLSIDMI